MTDAVTPQISIVVAGRNDDYGKDFRGRLFRSALHNAALFQAHGIRFEYVLAEWNPLPDRPLLSEEFVALVPGARAVVIPAEVHRAYSLNPQMPFHEMPAKNAALRRASGDCVIVTNADILFGEELVRRIAAGGFAVDTLYRAHRIDVSPDLDWEEMQRPANQLPSGEGVLPPPPYLGAGGDFCLASRKLWHSLRGFGEGIRFSTRAKDWQFFLSAMARGVGVEFIGDVYHLDHEGGFRNTGTAELNGETVHFGGMWDIEFGLPVMNSPGWGFDELPERPHRNDSRIVVLDGEDYFVSGERNWRDRELLPWVTHPPNVPDMDSAFLLHAICAAHRERRRIICKVKDGKLAVALAGFASVAFRFWVQIFCDWDWPSECGYYTRYRFSPEPETPREEDWILERQGGRLHLRSCGDRSEISVLPVRIPVDNPEFNPMLARRLLYAWLQLQDAGARKIAICGGGSHTKSLLRWGLPDSLELTSVVDSAAIASGQRPDADACLLSSASFETDMQNTCERHGVPNVVALYGGWPRDMWSAEGNTQAVEVVECLA